MNESINTFIEKSVDEMIRLQTLLSAIPAISPSSGGEGEAKKVEALLGWLKEKGFKDIERFDVPDDRVPSGIRPNLVVTLPGKVSGSVFWIMSHTDIVPPGEMKFWETDPYKATVKDGKIYGRGVEDNQQGMTASAFAALSLLKNGALPNRTVKLLFAADEEFGSDFGIKYLIKHHDLFKPADLALVPDGGDEKGEQIEVAEKGLLWLKFTLKGKQCHASRPDQGINAFEAGSKLVMRLTELRKIFSERNPIFEPDYSTFCPTKKEANVPNINTIPGDDCFYLDCRVLPSIPITQVLEEIAGMMKEVEKEYGVYLTVETIQRVESIPTPEDSPLVAALSKAIKNEYGVNSRPVGIGGGTVGAFLRNVGVHTAVWSKIDETAHQPNEYCKLENIVGDAKVMANLMLTL